MKTTARFLSIVLVLACLLACLPVLDVSAAVPTTSVVTTDKSSYAVDEYVTFNINANGAVTHLWVYRVDGQWQNTYLNVGTSYQLPFGWAGEYKALVQTWNGNDNLISEYCYFTVVPAPTKANVSISSIFVPSGQSVTFTMDSDGDQNDLLIYYPDGTEKRYSNVGTSYKLTFTQQGQYKYRMETTNASGSLYSHSDDASWPGFTVVAPVTTKPTTAKPTTAKPTTAKPTTAKPTTAKPTAAPTTVKPTAAPTTVKPTAAPTTVKPTAAPTTVKPTAAPTTVKPTAAPTTVKPTAAPTTVKPTAAPTTVKPVTVKPTNKVVKPNSASVITNKQTYQPGEEVTFVCSGNGTSHVLWIYYPNGTRKSFSNVGATYNLTFDQEGMYGALLQAKNSAGTYEGEAITFMVKASSQTTDPTTPPETQPTTPPETEPDVIPSWLTRPSSAPQATQPSGNGGSSSAGSFWLWFWLALILFVVFIVIAILLLVKRNKKDKKEG